MWLVARTRVAELALTIDAPVCELPHTLLQVSEVSELYSSLAVCSTLLQPALCLGLALAALPVAVPSTLPQLTQCLSL